ncbi:MAG: FAD-dependent oxidoreductase [Deltaproteobacteria bacterium]|nr:FAD-dependent oxidoreductase [Deltaproteobacteria bacterium]
MKKTAKKTKTTKTKTAPADVKQHVIVGNCIAAVSAAEELRKQNPNDKIVVIGDEEVPSYSRCLITYYLGGMITRSHLLSHTEKWYSDRNIDLMLSTRAEGLDVNKRQVICRSNGKQKKVSYDNLLVATGSSPIFLPMFPYDPDGIIGMRDYADSSTLKKWAKKGKKAIIIGAGFVGLKSAYGLVKQGVKVKVVELLPTVLGRMTDLEASARVRERLTNHPLLDIELNNSVIATRKQGDKYVVTYQDGGEEAADFIVASVGVKANTDFLADSGVEIDRIVSVDDGQRTSVEGIYAAGDVCRSRHIVTGDWIYNAIWPVAAAQGRIAACNMSGQNRTYEGNIPMNSVDFYELWITAIGDVQLEGDDIEEITFKSPAIYQKIKLRDGIPLAFMAIGNVDGAGIVRGAIVGQTPWEEFIQRPHAQVLPIVNQLGI